MLALETKQSGGKLLPSSDLRGGGMFLGEASRRIQREVKLVTWTEGVWEHGVEENVLT